MGGWLSACPGAFDTCEVCGWEFPAGSLDRWHLVQDADGVSSQVCSGCAVKLRERMAEEAHRRGGMSAEVLNHGVTEGRR